MVDILVQSFSLKILADKVHHTYTYHMTAFSRASALTHDIAMGFTASKYCTVIKL